MATIARICLQSLLKLVNSVLGMVGIAMVLYGLWMVRVWLRDMDSSSVDQYDAAAAVAPWFICTFLGAGVFLCAITGMGYLAAKFAHGCCLSCYMLIIFLVLLLETAMAADILLNSDWEKDLPYDPTGKFHDFKDFVKSNFDMFKWIGLLIVLAQGFSILLALALRSVEPNQGSSYDSDEECPPARLPLINPNVEPLEYIVAAKNNNWNSNK
ncbi:tetraspanin-19-like [Prunus yedoensis var. nudiflora]|uniref:Tetraspanin-19-like n=1 Tax=Prunus yedoensis var. nudiflora TaxID=2094558 RepID=A0A314UAH3_PRUYE|nr:tetraspanin-19-like [Prunus yedoensis var. nudiflora]